MPMQKIDDKRGKEYARTASNMRLREVLPVPLHSFENFYDD